MTRLSDIPIRVEHSDPVVLRDSVAEATIGGGVTAILAEIAAALERLAAGGASSAIDLRSLPMSDRDREQLIAALGPGEVQITLDPDGASSIRETDVRGVWWTEYRDAAGARLAAFIEVAPVPGILAVEPDELRQGAQRLFAAVAAAGAS